jgi:ABC-type nitrate/sulfonate/bicarbonate transport system permease component
MTVAGESVRAVRKLSAKKRRERQRMVRATVAVLVFLAIWQVLVSVRALNPLFISSPLGMITSLVTLLVHGKIWPDLRASAVEFALGFGFGALGGCVLGVLIGWLPFLDDISDPFIAGFYATPYISFLPVIILWFGIDLSSKVIIIAWATFFPVLINAIAGVKNTPPEFLRVARSFNVSRPRLLRTVVVPAAVPFILAGLRQGIGRGLVGVIVAEFYIADRGVGFFISQATSAFQTNDAFAAILILGVAGVVLVRLVAAVERHFSEWGGRAA